MGEATETAVSAGTGTLRGSGRTVLPKPGERLGRYALDEQLGAGGMGAVFVAHDPELDRRVALKVIRPELDDDPDAAARLVREAQSLARLQHPSVVAVFEVCESDGHTFIAMEYVRGRTLRSWQRDAVRTTDELLDAYLQAGRGLAAAHAVEIVHRDFKPANVLIGDDGRARVLDFGIATLGQYVAGPGPTTQRVTGGSLDSLTRVGDVLGTPAYMAPEQSRGAAVDDRCDQYAFCVALHEALYGARPFDALSVEELVSHKEEGRVERRTPPRGRKVSGAVRRVILRGLRPDPEARWPSMGALLQGLERARRPRVQRWAAVGLVAVPLAAGAWWNFTPPVVAGCEPPADAFADVWDEPVKAELAARFASSELPRGAEVFERLSPVLDGYAGAWHDGYREACGASAAMRIDDAAFDVRMTCLRRRQSALGSLVELLREGDDEVLREAGRAAGSLPRIEDCVRQDVSTSEVLPPREPELAGRVEALQRRLATARTLEVAGQYEEALLRTGEVLEEARTVEYPPLRLQTEALRGRILGRLGKLDESIALLEATAHEAAAIGHYGLEVEAATALTYLVGYTQQRDEEGLRWARKAQAAIDAGQLPDVVLATLQTNLASVHFAAGRVPDALELYDSAFAIRQRDLGPRHPETGTILANLASTLVQAGKLDEAERVFLEAIELWESVLGSLHPNVAVTLNGLAAVYERQHRYTEAIPVAERAVAIRRAALADTHPELATALETLGSLHLQAERWETAAPLFHESLRIREAALPPGHMHIGSSHTNLAILAERQERFDDAVASARKATSIFEASVGPDHPFLAYPLTSWGIAALGLGDTDAAVTHLERAHQLRTGHPTPAFEAARTAFGLARAVAAVGEVDRGIGLAQTAAQRLRDRLRKGGAIDDRLLRRIESWIEDAAARAPAE